MLLYLELYRFFFIKTNNIQKNTFVKFHKLKLIFQQTTQITFVFRPSPACGKI